MLLHQPVPTLQYYDINCVCFVQIYSAHQLCPRCCRLQNRCILAVAAVPIKSHLSVLSCGGMMISFISAVRMFANGCMFAHQLAHCIQSLTCGPQRLVVISCCVLEGDRTACRLGSLVKILLSPAMAYRAMILHCGIHLFPAAIMARCLH